MACSSIKQAVLAYDDINFSFIECVAFLENLIEPIEEMKMKYYYLDAFGEDVSCIVKDMEDYENKKLGFLFRDKNVYQMIKRSITKNEKENFYKNFILNKFIENGVNLSKEKIKELKDIDILILKDEKDFLDNIKKDKNDWIFSITEKEYNQLNDKLKKLFIRLNNSYQLSFSINSYLEIMTYCDDKDLRMKLENKYLSICNINSKYCNKNLMEKIIKNIWKKAKILDFNTPADMFLKNNMETKYEKIIETLNRFNEKIKPIAVKEYDVLKDFFKSEYNQELDSSSYLYAIEKHKNSLFKYEKDGGLKRYISGEEEEYMPTIENALPIIFDFIYSLYGIELSILEKKEIRGTDIYILSFSEDNKLKGNILLDLYERENKSSGAWATNIIPLRNEVDNGKTEKNEHDIFKRKKSKLALFGVSSNFEYNKKLTFNNLKTLLHEFGHCLHYASSKTDFSELSGTKTLSRDAVEIPSMMLEKFYKDEKLINKLTKGKMPKSLIDLVARMDSFMIGDHYNRRLISPALYDMKIFSDKKLIESNDVLKSSIDFYNDNLIFKMNNLSNQPLVFTHIFGGNYKSGYYGYFWADVYAINAFNLIKNDKNKSILFKKEFMSVGSSIEPMVAYHNFNKSEITEDNIFDFYDI